LTTFLIFSITRGKEISMEILETTDEEDIDSFNEKMLPSLPPYLGESIVVKKDDTRRFKLKSHVEEV
jgi:hypothetical protein